MLKLKENETLYHPAPAVVPARLMPALAQQLDAQGVEYETYVPALDFLFEEGGPAANGAAYRSPFPFASAEWAEGWARRLYDAGAEGVPVVVASRILADVIVDECMKILGDPDYDEDVCAAESRAGFAETVNFSATCPLVPMLGGERAYVDLSQKIAPEDYDLDFFDRGASSFASEHDLDVMMALIIASNAREIDEWLSEDEPSLAVRARMPFDTGTRLALMSRAGVAPGRLTALCDDGWVRAWAASDAELLLTFEEEDGERHLCVASAYPVRDPLCDRACFRVAKRDDPASALGEGEANVRYGFILRGEDPDPEDDYLDGYDKIEAWPKRDAEAARPKDEHLDEGVAAVYYIKTIGSQEFGVGCFGGSGPFATLEEARAAFEGACASYWGEPGANAATIGARSVSRLDGDLTAALKELLASEDGEAEPEPLYWCVNLFKVEDTPEARRKAELCSGDADAVLHIDGRVVAERIDQMVGGRQER